MKIFFLILFALFIPSTSFAEDESFNAYIKEFSRIAIENSYSFDYKNYSTLIEENAKKYFTKSGKNGFISALNESGNVIVVAKRKLKVDTIVVGGFNVERIGKEEKWKVDTTIKVAYTSSNGTVLGSKNYQVKLILFKVKDKVISEGGKVSSTRSALKVQSFFIF